MEEGVPERFKKFGAEGTTAGQRGGSWSKHHNTTLRFIGLPRSVAGFKFCVLKTLILNFRNWLAVHKLCIDRLNYISEHLTNRNGRNVKKHRWRRQNNVIIWVPKWLRLYHLVLLIQGACSERRRNWVVRFCQFFCQNTMPHHLCVCFIRTAQNCRSCYECTRNSVLLVLS